jgi:hypothetical protein
MGQKILTKEQATEYVFSQNVQQSRLLNGVSRGMLQAFVAVGGLLFSGFEHEVVKDEKQALFIDLMINVMEMAVLLNAGAMIAIYLSDHNFEIGISLVPYLVLIVSTGIAFMIVSRKQRTKSHAVHKSVSFSGLILLTAGAQLMVHLLQHSTSPFFEQLSSHSFGIILTGMVSVGNLFFGFIIGISVFKAMVAKQFGIDLSPFFDGDTLQDGYPLKWK